MPLTRYQIRSQYALADPELYTSSDKDDPESVLESVAMAGLVGVLRQLGDLAQFAAEIFHDLHEEVIATAARGHGLMARVQQLEAEFPSLEKAILSKTNHSSFFSNGGVEWHPNLNMEQNLITRGDLPRFVMDSYEECRGPPRLFLLDKYDVAGAGACLKRYTDPSFFKVEVPFNGLENVEVQREKKIRKVKRKGSRWRNGETPEIRPASHAKLHQLLMEERIQNNLSDPARIVRLKKRQFNDPPFESETGKSYMEKFLLDSLPGNRVACDASARSRHSEFTSDNTSDSGVDVVDIGTVSPPKRSSPEKQSMYLSADLQEVSEQSSLSEKIIDDETQKVLERNFSDGMVDNRLSFEDMISEKDLTVDREQKTKKNVDDYHSDDATSEIDNYMDALATMEADMDTDNEYRPNKAIDPSKLETHGADSDANEEQPDPQARYSDTHSLENFSASDDGNSSSKRERSSISHSDTFSTVAENMLSDSDGAGKFFPPERFTTVDMPPDQHTSSAGISEVQSHDIETNAMCIDEGEIFEAGGASIDSNDRLLENTSMKKDKDAATSCACVVDSGHVPHPLDSEVAPDLDESPSDDFDRSDVSKTDEDMASLGDSSVVSSNPSQLKDYALSPEPTKSCAVDELHEGDQMVSSDVMHSSNILDPYPEKKSSDNEVIQPECASEISAKKLASAEVGSPQSTRLAPEEPLHPHNTEFNMSHDADVMHESSTSVADSPPGLCIESVVAGVPNAEETPAVEDQYQRVLETDDTISLESHEISVPQVDVNQLGRSTSAGEPAPIEGSNLDLHDDGSCDQSEAQENFNAVLVGDDAISSESSPPRNLDSKPKYPNDTYDLENSHNDELLPAYPMSDPLISIAQSSELPTEPIKLGYMPPDVSTSKASNLQNGDGLNQETCPIASLKSCSELVSESAINPVDDICPMSGLFPVGTEANHECCTEDLPSQHLPVENESQSDSKELSVTELTEPSHSVGPDPGLLQAINQVNFTSEPLSSSELLVPSALTELGIKQSVTQTSYIHPDFDTLQRENQPSHTSSKSSLKGIVNTSAESLQQAFALEQNGAEQAMHSLISGFPFSGFAPLAPLEEMPPLPPLPPIQWRMATVQNTAQASQKDLFEQSHASFPSIHAHPFGEKHHFGFFSSEKGTLHSQNPFLSFSDMADENYQHVSGPSTDTFFDERSNQQAFLVSEATNFTNSFVDKHSIISAPSLPLPTAYDTAVSSGKLVAITSSEDQTVPNTLIIPQEQGHQSDTSVQQPAAEEVQLHYVLPAGKLEAYSSEDQPVQNTLRSSQAQGNQQDASLEQPTAEEAHLHHVLSAGKLEAYSSEDQPAQNTLKRSQEQGNQQDASVQQPTAEEAQLQYALATGELEAGTSSEDRPVKNSLRSSQEQGNKRDTSLQQPTAEEAQLHYVLSIGKLEAGTGAEDQPVQNTLRNSQEQGNQGDVQQPTREEAQFHNGLQSLEGEVTQTEDTSCMLPATEVGKPKKLPRPRSPLIDAVAAHDRSMLRKVTERVRPPIEPKAEERNSLLEQIRNKSFNLKPAAVNRPIVQGPKTNLKVAAILEKANKIRQAWAGSDEDDESDSWSDS